MGGSTPDRRPGEVAANDERFGVRPSIGGKRTAPAMSGSAVDRRPGLMKIKELNG
jgi:hypothetical protein